MSRIDAAFGIAVDLIHDAIQAKSGSRTRIRHGCCCDLSWIIPPWLVNTIVRFHQRFGVSYYAEAMHFAMQ